MKSSDDLGQRIARVRHLRGWSQTTLAREANTTRSMVSKVEGGFASPSASWIGAVATALGIDAARITGSYDENPEQLHQLVPTIRRALAAVDLLVDDVEPRPISEIRADIAQLGEWRRATKYRKIGMVLPDLVNELLAASSVVGESAYALLTGAYRAANTLGHKLGYADLSMTAVERML